MECIVVRALFLLFVFIVSVMYFHVQGDGLYCVQRG